MAIPKLRFKEFSDNWKEQQLNNVSEKIYDGTHQTPIYVEKGVPFYSVEHVTANQFEETKFISEDVFQKENKRVKIERGDILMTRIGSIGVTKLIDWDVRASFYVSLALIKQNKSFISNFLNQFIQSNFFQNELWKRTIHVAFPKKINLGEIGQCLIFLPSLPEQQKIATFLTAVDKRIALLQKKKDLLEDYKKGVMQQLFSQQLRFKDDNGQDFPDWEEKKLGEIAIKKSSNISANTIEDNFGVFKLYGASGYIKSIDFYREKEDFISIVKDGAGVGRTLLCEAKSSVLGTLDIIKPKIKVNLYFLFSILNNINFKKYIIGSTIPHIYFKDYSKEKINIPSLREQQKIASFLEGLDTKINIVNQQLEGMQSFKKGLLQQMFV